MRNVFLQVRQKDQLGVLNSDSAGYRVDERTGSRYVLFENGSRYVGKPGALDYQVTRYRNYAVLLQAGEQSAGEGELEGVPTGVLLKTDTPAHRAELQWRASFVIAAVLLPLLGVAMGRFSFNEHRYAPIFVAVFVYFIYSNLLGISKTLVKRGDLPDAVGLWWVHLLLIATIIVILKSRRHRRRRARAEGTPA
jgi:lipopolysaccharide export system permease protein